MAPLDALSPGLTAQLNRTLVAAQFIATERLSAWLQARGCQVQEQELQRYAHRFKRLQLGLRKGQAFTRGSERPSGAFSRVSWAARVS